MDFEWLKPIVYYRPLELCIPDEEVVKSLYLKLYERTLNYMYNSDEDGVWELSIEKLSSVDSF